MALWIWYAAGTDEQITAACEAARLAVERRGFGVRAAFSAAMDVADLDDDAPETGTPNDGAVAAWYEAEEAAFESLAALTGQWPERATLIWTEPVHGE